MQARRATMDDVADITEMGSMFHASIAPPWSFDGDKFGAFMGTLMKTQFVARTDGGFIVGIIADHPFSVWRIAKEFLWWATDGGGKCLRKSFREWSVSMGSNEIQWSCPANSARVRAIYSRDAVMTETVYSEYHHVP